MGLSAPKQMASGDQLNPADVENHIMIVAPIEFIPHIQTEFTKAGEQSPAIRVNVADFFDANNPVIYRGVLWFNVALYNNLKSQIGEFIAAKMYRGQASPGKSAPWMLEDMTQNADWLGFLGGWLDNSDAGREFKAEATKEVANASNLSAPAAANPTQATPPPSTPPAARPPASTPPPAPAAAAAPAAPTTPAPAAPAGDVAAMLAGLPEEERAKMLAILAAGSQGNASS